MKVGDLVRKVSGAQQGEIGVIVSVVTNSYDKAGPTTILTVINRGEIKNWYSDYVEIIDKKQSN